MSIPAEHRLPPQICSFPQDFRLHLHLHVHEYSFNRCSSQLTNPALQNDSSLWKTEDRPTGTSDILVQDSKMMYRMVLPEEVGCMPSHQPHLVPIFGHLWSQSWPSPQSRDEPYLVSTWSLELRNFYVHYCHFEQAHAPARCHCLEGHMHVYSPKINSIVSLNSGLRPHTRALLFS